MVGLIVTADRGQDVQTVFDLTSGVVISDIGDSVVVERIGCEDGGVLVFSSVYETHVLPHAG